MNSRPKIDFVITARPSWARVKRLITEFVCIEGSDAARISLLGAAISEKYGDISSQMPPEINVNSFESFNGNDNLFMVAKSCIDGARSLSQHWNSNPPQSVFVIADRTETLGVAVAAATMQIPLVHLQGGEISGSIDHKIREANSKLADLHLTTNSTSASNLVKLGEKLEDIVVIGCPSIDLVLERLNSLERPHPSSELYGGVGENFSTRNPYGIIMFHPDTFNVIESELWVDLILEMTRKSELNWFWFWPNVDFGGSIISKKIRSKRESNSLINIRFIKNLSPEKFIDLAIQAKIIVGNSSFGIREASAIGLATINLGHRQVGRERASNVLDISSPSDLREACIEHSKKRFERSKIYGDGNAAKLGAIALNKWNPKLKTNQKL